MDKHAHTHTHMDKRARGRDGVWATQTEVRTRAHMDILDSKPSTFRVITSLTVQYRIHLHVTKSEARKIK